MKALHNEKLSIGGWRVDPSLDEISTDGKTVKLEPRAMRLLVCLAEHAPQVVSVEQLLQEAWKDVIVTPDSVYHVVAALRRVLGDDGRDCSYIATVPRRGYRLVVPVAPWVDAPRQNSMDPAVGPPIVTHAVDPSGSSSHRARIVLSSVVALALGYVVVDKFWLSPPSPAEHLAAGASTNVFDRSIAVLPFIDMSETRDQEYFADGMAEQILDVLATIPALKVIGRTSSFQFKGKNEDLRAIGATLGVAYLLEGSVRKSGNRVRVAAQLLDSHDGTHRWSGTYDRDMGDVLKMQEEIAAGLVRALQITVGADGLQARPIANSDAYNLYLRGRYALNRLDKEGFDEAARYFERALELDPTSATTAAWLSKIYQLQGEWEFAAPAVAFALARRAAESALQQDPTLALPHVVLGAINSSYDHDWAAGDKEFQRALVLAPNDAAATFYAARLSMNLGRFDEALTQVNAALAQDPLSAGYYQVLDWIQARRGHLREAEAAARRALEISPTFDSAHFFLGLVLLERGEPEAAVTEMEKETLTGGQLAGLAMAYYALGRKAESDAALARMIRELGNGRAFQIAEACAFRGERDRAFHWLERAYAQKESDLQYIKVDVPLKNLDAYPRYGAFLRKMNLPE
jgi:TolB-like protein/DNA-binding winged helix-turn-helix (wHTH) protein/lipopolysaccharide biosynthesis regulator YciM